MKNSRVLESNEELEESTVDIQIIHIKSHVDITIELRPYLCEHATKGKSLEKSIQY